jgi:hypothetical protein
MSLRVQTLPTVLSLRYLIPDAAPVFRFTGARRVRKLRRRRIRG